MIKAALQVSGGPIGIIGITDENVVRMRAGMPLDIDLKEITPPSTRINRVIIQLAHTHEQLIDEMEQAGLPVTAEFRQMARDLDVQLKKERMERGRKQPDAR